ncbi:K02A2.6-like [Cordylochernes scorpioides]|uniref:K02A2.6-like n=1 Tax=Cordylochernes scorpioides TaxID=51811 RepID=A0ABY6LXB7_9ARAC|nr:K02A2.6-like [Cordylochernes scorpioides]
MKKNYDKKHMERSYEPGELVTVWTPIRKIGKCEKLLRKYFGPYRILKMSSVNYLIEPKYNPGQDPLIVHVSKIKPYYERMDESLNLFKMKICLNPEKYRFEKKDNQGIMEFSFRGQYMPKSWKNIGYQKFPDSKKYN